MEKGFDLERQIPTMLPAWVEENPEPESRRLHLDAEKVVCSYPDTERTVLRLNVPRKAPSEELRKELTKLFDGDDFFIESAFIEIHKLQALRYLKSAIH